jgi:predicted peptidase
LHGAAARGTDNAEPLNWGPKLFLDPALRKAHQFFLLVPQCPKDNGWIEANSGRNPHFKEGDALAMSLEVMTQVLPKEYNLNPKKRYLTGVSMGGHATWVLLERHPGLFAAAIPVCSGGDPADVTKAAARTPVWAFHSDDDHLVPVEQARALVKAWREQGGTAKYTEYTGLKHSSWKKAYIDASMFDWLFRQETH